jgi:hypothetical protein
MSGANIMCPGVTHENVLEGNKALGDLPVGTPVVRKLLISHLPITNFANQAIYAEAKIHPLAIGYLKMSMVDM